MAAKNKRDQYMGLKNFNSQGYEMEVVAYKTYDEVQIKFLAPYECIVTTKMHHFKDGTIRNPYAPSVCGFGIVGNKYSTVTQDGKTIVLNTQPGAI